MYKIFISAVVAVFISGCGGAANRDDDGERARLIARIDALEQISGSLSSMVYSDFATCPASGDTADPLIQKMCQVAQAATVETRVELKGELASFVQSLQGQIDVVNTNLSANQADLNTINTQISTINATLLLLDGRLTSAENAIVALQNLTASISTTLNGTMMAVDIGTENVAAGPLYETVLRRVDRKRFTGYVTSYDAALGLAANPITAVNGSSTVTVNFTAHGYVVGNRIEFAGLVGSRGFSNGHVYGVFVVQTAVANSFTIQLAVPATSNGTVGGSSGTMRRINGQGMGTLWNAGDTSDVAVRLSNLGTKQYNFIIRRKASDVSNQTSELCYSKTNNAATFATINASVEGGNATIACK